MNKDRIEYVRPKVRFFLNDQPASEEEYRVVYPLEHTGPRHFLGGAILSAEEYAAVDPLAPRNVASADGLITFQPVHSLSLRVRPDQIEEARQVAKHKGVPTDFTPDGRPIFNSSRHMRTYAIRHGYRHQDY